MDAAARDDRLLALITSYGAATVAQLSEEIGVGESTVRRLLRRLADTGRIVRTYGGATVADPHVRGTAADPPRALSEKRRIGAAAAELVHDGQTIVVTGGSTTAEFARHLVLKRDLTVITNSLDVARVLLDRDGVQLVVLGGVARPGMHSLLGHITAMACREVRAETLFMGIGAVSLEHGLMNDYVPEILTDRALRSTAASVVVLADADKFRSHAPACVFGLEEVDTIVTDDGLEPGVIDGLTARGINVVVA